MFNCLNDLVKSPLHQPLHQVIVSHSLLSTYTSSYTYYTHIYIYIYLYIHMYHIYIYIVTIIYIYTYTVALNLQPRRQWPLRLPASRRGGPGGRTATGHHLRPAPQRLA